jgi:hypothetical protein
MAAEFLTEVDLMARWGIAKAALNKLVETARLHPSKQQGQTVFSESEVEALEKSHGGKDFIGVEEVLQELQLNRSELDELVRAGKLMQYRFGDETRFEVSEAEGLVTEKRPTGMEKRPTDVPALEKMPTAIQEAEPIEAEEEPKTELNVEKAEALEEEALFEFGEELEPAVKPKAEKKPEKAKVPEEEMITDVLDVGEETSEEELLGDIIEDVGGGEVEAKEEEAPAPTVAPTGEETVEVEASQDATAEITQMEEEALEGEELENILAGEEAAKVGEGEEEDFEVPSGAPMEAMEAEAPVPGWALALLVISFVMNLLAGLYVLDAVNPQYSSGLARMLNPFK